MSVTSTAIVLYRCCEHCRGESHDLDTHVYPCYDGVRDGGTCQGGQHVAAFSDAYSRSALDGMSSLALLDNMISSRVGL